MEERRVALAIYTPACVKQTTRGRCHVAQGPQPCAVMACRDGAGRGRGGGSRVRGHTCPSDTDGLTVHRQCRRSDFHPWVRKIPWRRGWPPTPVSLVAEAHGWRSLMGYSLWGCKESDPAERLSTRCWLTVSYGGNWHKIVKRGFSLF